MIVHPLIQLLNCITEWWLDIFIWISTLKIPSSASGISGHTCENLPSSLTLSPHSVWLSYVCRFLSIFLLQQSSSSFPLSWVYQLRPGSIWHGCYVCQISGLLKSRPSHLQCILFMPRKCIYFKHYFNFISNLSLHFLFFFLAISSSA